MICEMVSKLKYMLHFLYIKSEVVSLLRLVFSTYYILHITLLHFIFATELLFMK